MIPSFATTATRRFAEDGRSRKFSGLDTDKTLELLAALHAAKSLKDISPLKRVGLHALKGGRQGQWAMTVNAGWRICFRFDDGHAHGVEIVDYH